MSEASKRDELLWVITGWWPGHCGAPPHTTDVHYSGSLDDVIRQFRVDYPAGEIRSIKQLGRVREVSHGAE